MTFRLFKIVLVLFVGLQGWFYVAENLANWPSAVGAVSYVISQQDHAVYPVHVFPALTDTFWAALGLATIVTGEFLVGALSMIGFWKLWAVRKADAATFNASKETAMMGAAMAMVVWFGGFIVIGGALFAMWQTQVGDGSLRGAFIYAVTSAMVLLVLAQKDD